MQRKLLLKIAEAVELTGWGRSFIYERIATGEIPTVRVGRSVRVPMDALERFIREKTSPSVNQVADSTKQPSGA